MVDDSDGRKKRIGGAKVCEECQKPFEAFRPWGKFCNKKCGRTARARRYWNKQKQTVVAQ